MPPSAAATRLQIIASPMTMPRPGTLNQAQAATPVMTAKASPLSSPTNSSRRMTRQALASVSSRVASARTATVMVWVVALPPWLATIGASTASATIFCKRALEQAEHRGGQERGREIDQQPVEAALGDGPDRVRQLFVAGHAAERLDVLFGLLLDHVDDVVEGEHADQALAVVDHRRRDQVVALEHARHLLLVVGGADPSAVRLHQIGDRHRPLGAQQPVERHRAEQLACLVDHVELEEALRQIGGLAHVVDGLRRRSRTAAPR